MKTAKIFSVLSLALILFAAHAFATTPADKKKPEGTSKYVRYEVKITLSTEKTICNTYQVILVDINGRAVAPPQTFLSGKDTYTFYEQTRQDAGVRIARLVLAPNIDHFACMQELFTAPDVQIIHFVDRETYSFNLFPQFKPTKPIE